MTYRFRLTPNRVRAAYPVQLLIMKAMCINDNVVNTIGIYPKVGEVLTVKQSDFYPDNYVVLEYPIDKSGHHQSFGKYRFIPLSDIDETELIKERELINT